MTCRRCTELERQLSMAHDVIEHLWKQSHLRDQLASGTVTAWDREMPPPKSLLGVRLKDAA